MPGVWLIGLAFPVALLAGVLIAFLKRHPLRLAIGVGATMAIVFWLFGWSLARAVADGSQTFTVLFLQLSLCTIAGFIFVVATMVATRIIGRQR